MQNTYDAEYGRNAGAQVNVVLKSGASRTQGSLFEYFRHESLDARGVFDPPDEPTPLCRRNQFGGTVGGPIAKLPGLLFRQPRRPAHARRGHARRRRAHRRERTGDFSAPRHHIDDPLTGGLFRATRSRSAARRDRPARSAPCTRARTAPPRPELRHRRRWASRDGVRVHGQDRSPWRGTPLFAALLRQRATTARRHSRAGTNLPGFGTANIDIGQNLGGRPDQSFWPHVFNELRVGWNRLHRDNVPGGDAGIDGSRRSASPAPARARATRAIPPSRWPGTSRSATMPTCRCAAHAHAARVRQPDLERGRHL